MMHPDVCGSTLNYGLVKTSIIPNMALCGRRPGVDGKELVANVSFPPTF
jgi:hypothetical protein